jgi:hypothetical protein
LLLELTIVTYTGDGCSRLSTLHDGGQLLLELTIATYTATLATAVPDCLPCMMVVSIVRRSEKRFHHMYCTVYSYFIANKYIKLKM